MLQCPSQSTLSKRNVSISSFFLGGNIFEFKKENNPHMYRAWSWLHKQAVTSISYWIERLINSSIWFGVKCLFGKPTLVVKFCAAQYLSKQNVKDHRCRVPSVLHRIHCKNTNYTANGPQQNFTVTKSACLPHKRGEVLHIIYALHKVVLTRFGFWRKKQWFWHLKDASLDERAKLIYDALTCTLKHKGRHL